MSAGVKFAIFGGLTLKPGRQRNHFFEVLRRWDPSLVRRYKKLYGQNEWGSAEGEYYQEITQRFSRVACRLKIPRRMPPALYTDLLSRRDLVVLMLEHLDYLCRCHGQPTPYGRVARAVAQMEVPQNLSLLEPKPRHGFDLEALRRLPGVGDFTQELIQEILKTGRCHYLEDQLF